MISLKEERFVMAHSFRGFSPSWQGGPDGTEKGAFFFFPFIPSGPLTYGMVLLKVGLIFSGETLPEVCLTDLLCISQSNQIENQG